MRRFKEGDKVCVHGLDMAFVVACYLDEDLVKLFIEGESYDTMHAIIHARPDVLLPNNLTSLIKEGWIQMKFVNLTPHEIVVRLDDGSDQRFPSEGNCRVAVTQKENYKVDGIPVYMNHYGAVEGLPDYKPNTMYIVSLDFEKQKITKALKAGIKKYYLSYVESQHDVDEFIELVGKDSEIILKIESVKGLEYVTKFKKKNNITLMAARGDLYVEVAKPHDIIAALKLIINADSEAIVGSRIFLSVVKDSIPECCDFLELAWLYDQGYRKMLLCDEICLKDKLLTDAVMAFNAFCTTL